MGWAEQALAAASRVVLKNNQLPKPFVTAAFCKVCWHLAYLDSIVGKAQVSSDKACTPFTV